MSDNRLGERVDIDQILEEDLPFPGDAPSAFAGAQGMDTPFGATAGTTAASKKPGLDVDGYDPAKAPIKAPAKAPTPAPAGVASAQNFDAAPPVVNKPNPKNMSMQLRRFREAFGLKRISTKSHTITRLGPDDEKTSFTFQLRVLNYEDYQWAIAKAGVYAQENEVPLVLAFHFSTVAISVCAMDVDMVDGARPTPLHEVFGVDVDLNSLRDPYYPSVSLRTAIADLFFEELVESFFDVVEELHQVVDEYILVHSRAVNNEKDQEGPLV